MESMRSPQEKYAAKQSDLNRLLAIGAIDQKTHARAMAEAAKDLKSDLLEAQREKERLAGVLMVDLRLGGLDSFLAGTAAADDALAAVRLQQQYGPASVASGGDRDGVLGALNQIASNTAHQFNLNVQQVGQI